MCGCGRSRATADGLRKIGGPSIGVAASRAVGMNVRTRRPRMPSDGSRRSIATRACLRPVGVPDRAQSAGGAAGPVRRNRGSASTFVRRDANLRNAVLRVWFVRSVTFARLGPKRVALRTLPHEAGDGLAQRPRKGGVHWSSTPSGSPAQSRRRDVDLEVNTRRFGIRVSKTVRRHRQRGTLVQQGAGQRMAQRMKPAFAHGRQRSDTRASCLYLSMIW